MPELAELKLTSLISELFNGKKNKKALVKIKQGQTINIFEGV